MDVNLTGTLITTSESNYIPLLTQLVIGFMTVGGTLGGVLLVQKHSDRMHAKEEKEKWLEAQENSYQNFLDVFSRRNPTDSNDLVERSGAFLKATLNVIKFGDVHLSEHLDIVNFIHSEYSEHDRYAFNWENDNEIRKFLTQKTGYSWIDTGEIEKTDNVKTINKLAEYVFSWEDIPGSDNKRLIDFLIHRFGLFWIQNPIIEKIENDKTIKLSSGQNALYLKLNDIKDEVILGIDDDIIAKFKAKMENDKLKIYFAEKKRISLEINALKNEVIVKTEINDFLFIFTTRLEKGQLRIYDTNDTFKMFEENKVLDWEIQSLNDIIITLFKIKYDINIFNNLAPVIELIRRICIKKFGPKLLKDLIEHRQSSESR